VRALLLAGLLFGCGAKRPEAVADRFVDLYFVEIDQQRALPLTAGLAHSKLEEELSLVQQVRQQAPPDLHRPTIHYQRRSLEVADGRARVSYDITVTQGRDQTERNALITVEQQGGSWRVGNFIVREGPLPVRPGPAPAAAETPAVK